MQYDLQKKYKYNQEKKNDSINWVESFFFYEKLVGLYEDSYVYYILFNIKYIYFI